MFHNMKCPYPVILLISNHRKCLYRDIQRVCTTVLSAPRYGQGPKCSKSTLSNIQQYPKYSKSIQIMYPVYSSKSSQQHKYFIYIYIYPFEYYIPRHNSLPYSQRILSSLVVRCALLIYHDGSI